MPDEEVLSRIIAWVRADGPCWCGGKNVKSSLTKGSTFQVQSMIVDFGICPFTSTSAMRAGVPPGEVRYSISRATTPEGIFKDYWSEVSRVIDSDERSLATTLLIT